MYESIETLNIWCVFLIRWLIVNLTKKKTNHFQKMKVYPVKYPPPPNQTKPNKPTKKTQTSNPPALRIKCCWILQGKSHQKNILGVTKYSWNSFADTRYW